MWTLLSMRSILPRTAKKLDTESKPSQHRWIRFSVNRFVAAVNILFQVEEHISASWARTPPSDLSRVESVRLEELNRWLVVFPERFFSPPSAVCLLSRKKQH